MDLLVTKRLGSLVPADDTAEEILRGYKQGELLRLSVPKRVRNPRFHRKFWAMLNIVFKNQEHYKSLDTLLGVCKIRVGHCDVIQTKHGIVQIPRSISFAKMDNAEFSKFYDAAVNWVMSEVIPGLKRTDLDAEVENELRNFAGVA